MISFGRCVKLVAGKMHEQSNSGEKMTEQTSERPRRRGLILMIVTIIAILLVSSVPFLIPTENQVALRLQSQGYEIIHNIDDSNWVWYRPTHFVCSHQDISDETLTELARMPKLFSVAFCDCDSSKLDLGLLAEIPNLTDLTFINNDGPCGTPKNVARLASCRKLESLSFFSTPLVRADIEPFTDIPLKELYCRTSGLTDADCTIFSSFKQLEILYLRDNPAITDASLSVFESITTLQYLCVETTGVTKEGIEEFKKKRPGVKLRTDWENTFGW